MKRALTYALVFAMLAAACGDDPVEPKVEINPPVLTAVSPAEGTIGTEVRIDGSGMHDSATVHFGALESPAVERETTALFAKAPAGITAGSTYDVIVKNPDGGADTLLAAFTAIAPTASRINGVAKPTGLAGMTIIVEGRGFGDDPVLTGGHVFFGNSDGTAIEAVIVDTANDWTDGFIVTSVPQGVSDTSLVWVETALGVSDSIEFRLIQSGTFSPSLIDWTPTSAMPQALQGLGAVFVPVEEGSSPANYVFAIAGADTAGIATDVLYRGTVLQSGALAADWTTLASLPQKRAYHATTAATAFTAALDTATTAAYIYVIGGQDTAGTAVADVFVGHVDLAGDLTAWQSTRALPVPLHSASAALFRGFVYVTGGAGTDNVPVTTTYRAAVNPDGTLGEWQTLASLPLGVAHHEFLNFGPFLYVVGGDSSAVPAVKATQSGAEVGDVYLARINLRNGDLTDAGWTATEPMGKGRSKHSTVFAGGSLFVSSGIYAGQAGSSENTAGKLLNDGTVEAWGGATGSETIAAELAYSLYNQAAVTFIDAQGNGHVLVLGGARRDSEGTPSAAVIYY